MIWIALSIVAYLACGIASPWLVRSMIAQSYTVNDNWEVAGWLVFWPVVWVVGIVSESFNTLLNFICERLMP